MRSYETIHYLHVTLDNHLNVTIHFMTNVNQFEEVMREGEG